MSSTYVLRATVTTVIAVTALLAVTGIASAHTGKHHPPHHSSQSSTDVRDYNTNGVESAKQPQQPYFNGGPAKSTVQSGYGLGGDPADGLLTGNVPVPAS